jgi:nucleotide-binding universal stress UspA family protein
MQNPATALPARPEPLEANPASNGREEELLSNAHRWLPGPASLLDYRPAQPPSSAKALASVLVATDFSPASAQAVERAVTLANQCHATLTILHVIDINAQPALTESGTAHDLMKRRWEEGSGRMGQLAWSLCGRVAARTMLEEGLPWEQIVEKSADFDLLILGKCRARKGWKLFSNRTAQRVIEHSACPVMVVTTIERHSD